MEKAQLDRISRIKNRLLEAKPRISLDRAVVLTDSYRESEGEELLIRRAKALSAVIASCPVKIHRDELIAGVQTPWYRGAPLFPEMSVDWIEEELKGSAFGLDKEEAHKLKAVVDYWKGKTNKDKILKRFPKEVRDYRDALVYSISHLEDSGLGHTVLDFAKVLRVGFDGLYDEAETRMALCDAANPEDYRKMVFWRAVRILCSGIKEFSERNAEKVRRLAETETDPARKRELETIAAVCEIVPWNPARSFREALQSIWYVQLFTFLSQNGSGPSFGRLDQTLYQYYQRDIENGTLTADEALELICCFYLKLLDLEKARAPHRTKLHGGLKRNQNITLGGVTRDGRDASNELTELFLEAERIVHLPEPQLTLRVTERMPDRLLYKASEVLSAGGGKPQLVSDQTAIASLLSRGIPLEDARDYAPIGCIELAVPGLWARCNAGYLNLPKILELTLNNGYDKRTKKQLGPKTGDPAEFKTFEDLVAAYRTQVRAAIKAMVTANNIVDEVNRENMPHLFMSTLMPGCMESGRDVTAGGARYNWTGPLAVGLANVGNSLYVLKELVFDSGRYTMQQFMEALRANFAGHEGLRRACLGLPKFGNDDDAVDMVTRLAAEIYFDELEKHRDTRGGTFIPGMYSLTSNIPLGEVTAATPDGRLAGTPLAEGISPAQGTDKGGPTAVFRSIGKIDLVRTTNGVILNQKFNPTLLDGSVNLQQFVSLVKTFLLDLGGLHVQFNIVSADTLRKAQQSPEKHADLLVRVTGYSAFFVELAPQIQEDIIARTEQINF